MKNYASFVCCLFLFGCATTEDVKISGSSDIISEQNSNCPADVANFTPKLTTNKEVTACIGREPDYIDQNPDGRFVYLYYFNKDGNKIALTYLFGSDNKLIKVKGFKKN